MADKNLSSIIGITDVANNAAKLALSVRPGQLVRITGEANRVEQYIAGSSSSDSSWRIIGESSYQLYIKSDTAYTINGVSVPGTGVSTSVGWVREGDLLTTNIDALDNGGTGISAIDIGSGLTDISASSHPQIPTFICLIPILVAPKSFVPRKAIEISLVAG